LNNTSNPTIKNKHEKHNAQGNTRRAPGKKSTVCFVSSIASIITVAPNINDIIIPITMYKSGAPDISFIQACFVREKLIILVRSLFLKMTKRATRNSSTKVGEIVAYTGAAGRLTSIASNRLDNS
jgi:hypothetical protein